MAVVLLLVFGATAAYAAYLAATAADEPEAEMPQRQLAEIEETAQRIAEFDARAESRAGLVLALGGVLGLMLAVFSAFSAEFLATAHREYRRRRDRGAL